MAYKQRVQQIAISDFKATCLSVLARVRRTGQPVLVTRRGEPIAQVIPPPPDTRPQSWIGCMAGKARIVGDVIAPAAGESEWEALQP